MRVTFSKIGGLGYTYQQAFFSEEGTGPTVTIQIG